MTGQAAGGRYASEGTCNIPDTQTHSASPARPCCLPYCCCMPRGGAVTLYAGQVGLRCEVILPDAAVKYAHPGTEDLCGTAATPDSLAGAAVGC